jgi:thioredoxin-disulfide reductase
MLKDLIIIGAGPAGITAAVYAARKKLNFCVISKDIGGQAALSGDIENYTGYQFISGPELALKFREHLEKFEFDLQEGEEVAKVEKNKDLFEVRTASGKTLSSKTLIIANGKIPRLLNVPGEEKFKNRGVTYCATCDGPLFANKAVAIIGGGNAGLEAALQMIKIATKVYLINLTDRLTGDMVMQEKVRKSENAEIFNNSKTTEIFGDKFVKGIRFEQAGKGKELAVEGILVEIGAIPNAGMIDFVDKNKNGEIILHNGCETSVPGLFAAGDVTDVIAKQIIIAAGEGAKSALNAFYYLSKH